MKKIIELVEEAVEMGFSREKAITSIDVTLDEALGYDEERKLDSEISKELYNEIWEGFEAEAENWAGEKSMYYINYHTGAGNETAKTLDEAMETAVANAAYTQQSISIEDENDNVVACLPWYGVKAEDDDVVTIDYGDNGFYGEWSLRQ